MDTVHDPSVSDEQPQAITPYFVNRLVELEEARRRAASQPRAA